MHRVQILVKDLWKMLYAAYGTTVYGEKIGLEGRNCYRGRMFEGFWRKRTGSKLMNGCKPEEVSTKEDGLLFKHSQVLGDGRIRTKKVVN